jgi:hypothetical protein
LFSALRLWSPRWRCIGHVEKGKVGYPEIAMLQVDLKSFIEMGKVKHKTEVRLTASTYQRTHCYIPSEPSMIS